MKEWSLIQGGRLRALIAYEFRLARQNGRSRDADLQALKDLALEYINKPGSGDDLADSGTEAPPREAGYTLHKYFVILQV